MKNLRMLLVMLLLSWLSLLLSPPVCSYMLDIVETPHYPAKMIAYHYFHHCYRLPLIIVVTLLSEILSFLDTVKFDEFINEKKNKTPFKGA